MDEDIARDKDAASLVAFADVDDDEGVEGKEDELALVRDPALLPRSSLSRMFCTSSSLLSDFFSDLGCCDDGG